MSDAELAVKFLQVHIKTANWRAQVAKGVVGAADDASAMLGRAAGAVRGGAEALPDLARSAVGADARTPIEKFLTAMQARLNDPARVKDMAIGGGVGAGAGAGVTSMLGGAAQTGQQISDTVMPKKTAAPAPGFLEQLFQSPITLKQSFVAGAVSGLNTVANKGSVGAGAVGGLTSETGAQLGSAGGATLAALLGELLGKNVSQGTKTNLAIGGGIAGYGVGGYLGHRLANSQLRDAKDRENRKITG